VPRLGRVQLQAEAEPRAAVLAQHARHQRLVARREAKRIRVDKLQASNGLSPLRVTRP
jgi:hypothetical protein